MTVEPPQACGDKRGTPAGRVRHQRAGEKTCEECQKANSEYIYRRHGRRYRARQRALTRLSHLYNDTYRTLLAEELAKEAAK